jgi:hypothetical protein
MKNTVNNAQEIIITNACTTTAIGEKRRKNAKPVLCITTGEVFASQKDAVEQYNITQSNLSKHLLYPEKLKSCKGLKFCFVSKTQEHYDEITQQMRDTTTVIMPKQVVKVPVPTKEKDVITIAQPVKQYGWLRTYFINLFKKFVSALEA